MAKLGMDVRLQAPFEKVVKEDNGQLSVNFSNSKETITADKILLALGRPPNLDGMGI